MERRERQTRCRFVVGASLLLQLDSIRATTRCRLPPAEIVSLISRGWKVAHNYRGIVVVGCGVKSTFWSERLENVAGSLVPNLVHFVLRSTQF